MIIGCYTIYDSATKAHMRPWYALTDGEAVRTFSDAVNDPASQYNKHPDDFTLFAIAHYDDEKATFQNQHAPVNLGGANTFKIEANPDAQ